MLCRPPSKSPDPVAVNEPVKVTPLPLTLPDTPRVPPTVALLLIVNALTVVLPLELTVVNCAVLGVELPIGVFCRPPAAFNVVPEVIDPLAVNAAAVILPVALTVVN